MKKNIKMSEMELVQSALSGNKAAMDKLLQRAKPWIKGLARTKLRKAYEDIYGSVECLLDEEDLVQEGLLVFCQMLGTYSDSYNATLKTYTYNYVRAAMRDMIKGVSTCLPVGDIEDCKEGQESLESLSSGALYHLIKAFLRRHLKPRDVMIVEKFYGIDTDKAMKAWEIARDMEVTPSVVNHVLERARLKLKSHKEELSSLFEDCFLPFSEDSVSNESSTMEYVLYDAA